MNKTSKSLNFKIIQMKPFVVSCDVDVHEKHHFPVYNDFERLLKGKIVTNHNGRVPNFFIISKLRDNLTDRK